MQWRLTGCLAGRDALQEAISGGHAPGRPSIGSAARLGSTLSELPRPQPAPITLSFFLSHIDQKPCRNHPGPPSAEPARYGARRLPQQAGVLLCCSLGRSMLRPAPPRPARAKPVSGLALAAFTLPLTPLHGPQTPLDARAGASDRLPAGALDVGAPEQWAPLAGCSLIWTSKHSSTALATMACQAPLAMRPESSLISTGSVQAGCARRPAQPLATARAELCVPSHWDTLQGAGACAAARGRGARRDDGAPAPARPRQDTAISGQGGCSGCSMFAMTLLLPRVLAPPAPHLPMPLPSPFDPCRGAAACDRRRPDGDRNCCGAGARRGCKEPWAQRLALQGLATPCCGGLCTGLRQVVTGSVCSPQPSQHIEACVHDLTGRA